jgi:hypothetical protein
MPCGNAVLGSSLVALFRGLGEEDSLPVAHQYEVFAELSHGELEAFAVDIPIVEGFTLGICQGVAHKLNPLDLLGACCLWNALHGLDPPLAQDKR